MEQGQPTKTLVNVLMEDIGADNLSELGVLMRKRYDWRVRHRERHRARLKERNDADDDCTLLIKRGRHSSASIGAKT